MTTCPHSPLVLPLPYQLALKLVLCVPELYHFTNKETEAPLKKNSDFTEAELQAGSRPIQQFSCAC